MSTTIESSWENERLKEEIESLRQQLANRELEVQHVLGKVVLVEQQLAAAHAARVSAQASGIRLLDQLAAAKEECNTLRRIHAENITILERKTAQAVAACKLKDEALEMCKPLAAYGIVGSRDVDQAKFQIAISKAIAIQPDDAALRTWLGEPVGEVKKHTGSLKDMAIIVWSGEQPEEGAQLYIKPKGLK